MSDIYLLGGALLNEDLSIESCHEDQLLAQFEKSALKEAPKLDISEIRRSWSEMRGALDLNELLSKIKASRLDVYQLIGIDYAMQIEKDAIYDILKGVVDYNIPILMSMGNGAVLQTYQGLIHKISSKGNWISILDGESSFHLQEERIHHVWIVKKPSINGMHISMELFDQSGDVLAIFSGADVGGISQCKWRKLVEQISSQSCI